MNVEFLATEKLPPEYRSSPFPSVAYQNNRWDLSHLHPFKLPHSLEGNNSLSIIVVFSCHCFTRSATQEEIAQNSIHPDHWFNDDREKRVLDEERYFLSIKYLPKLIHELSKRRITIADDRRRNGNFVTIEVENSRGKKGFYSVFFEIKKEKKQKLIIRVQSAYIRESLTAREQKAKSVKLNTLVKATLDGRKIKA